ncbi:MAG: cell division FtsA domain-containing protein, partial [Clostridia bacterium]|nr:cell division FtsA domain-containing protein [Clostridia bacterium]
EFATVVNKDVSINLDRRRHIADDDIDYLIARGKDFDEKNYICANTAAVYYSIDGDEKLITDVRGMTAQRVSARISYMLAEKRFVSMFDRIASDLGFRDVRYIVSDWAQCVMLLDEEQREDSFALLNIGYLSSSVTLAKGEGLLGMRSFSVGGGHISADIYSALEVPFDLAQEAKDMLDLNLNYAEDAVLVRDDNYIIYAGDACEIAKSRLNMLADVIATIFKDFAEDAPSYLPIYLTGDGIASMRGAKKYLSEKLKKNIEILTPTLPGFITAKDSSKTALLLMADTLSGGSLGDMIKSIFSGGKK